MASRQIKMPAKDHSEKEVEEVHIGGSRQGIRYHYGRR
jgi:hypothetical protein